MPCPEIVLLLYVVHMYIPCLLVMEILTWRRLNSASQMVQNWKAAAPVALDLDSSTNGSNLADAIGREALAASGMQDSFGFKMASPLMRLMISRFFELKTGVDGCGPQCAYL